MIGEEVKDVLHYHVRLLRTSIFLRPLPFTELGSKLLIFISVGPAILSVIVLMKILSGQGIVEVLINCPYLLFNSGYLINFFFNICFGFSAFALKT